MKCVITVDIEGSTKFTAHQRGQIQRSIFDVIEHLREKFADDLFAIGMTVGDEFQAVLNSPEKAIDFLSSSKTSYQRNSILEWVSALLKRLLRDCHHQKCMGPLFIPPGTL